MRARTRERYQALLNKRAERSSGGEYYPTIAQMMGKLHRIRNAAPATIYQYNNNQITSIPPGNNWDDNNVPVLDHNGQAALKTTIYQKLRQYNGAYTNGGPVLSADNGGQGLIQIIQPLNNPQTEGEVYTSNVSNLIVRCVYAYRVYRWFKRGRTGQDDFEEDEEILKEFQFIQRVLNGSLPNLEVPANAIPMRLENIYNKIFDQVKYIIEQPPYFEFDRLSSDERFTININTLAQNIQNWAAWNDPIIHEVKNLPGQNGYRDYDLICILADSIKLYSKKSRELQHDEVVGINHAIQTIGELLGHMQGTINQTADAEIKTNLQLCYDCLSKRIYTEIAKSLNEIMVRAIDDYYFKTQNQGKLPRSALMNLRKYNDLIRPAEKTLSDMENLNERMIEYGDRHIDKDVQLDLTMNTEMIREMLGA